MKELRKELKFKGKLFYIEETGQKEEPYRLHTEDGYVCTKRFGTLKEIKKYLTYLADNDRL